MRHRLDTRRLNFTKANVTWRDSVPAFELPGKMRDALVAQAQRNFLDAATALQQFERTLLPKLVEVVVRRVAYLFQEVSFQLPGGDLAALREQRG